MELLKGYLQFFRTRPNIFEVGSYAVEPEIGDVELVEKFENDLLSLDPALVQQAIERIKDTSIPLHIAASGLTSFIERDEFHKKNVFEQIIFNLAQNENSPPDSHINSAQFAETTSPFPTSFNRLALTRRGLERIYTKAQQSGYDFQRYKQISVETCVIASSELIAKSIEHKKDPVPVEFLHECSFGPLYANFIDLFGTDAEKVYKKSERGINLLYENGSFRDRQAIEQIWQRLAISS